MVAYNTKWARNIISRVSIIYNSDFVSLVRLFLPDNASRYNGVRKLISYQIISIFQVNFPLLALLMVVSTFDVLFL